MTSSGDIPYSLPPAAEIRAAFGLYLEMAYPHGAPAWVEAFFPSGDVDVLKWLMSDSVERDPRDAPFEQVRSFALRLGNWQYPHMKLRLSRPPRDEAFVFSVDAHDAFLRAEPGTADHDALEQLKAANSAVANAVHAAWDRAGLPTERNYLRRKIRQARDTQAAREGPSPGAMK